MSSDSEVVDIFRNTVKREYEMADYLVMDWGIDAAAEGVAENNENEMMNTHVKKARMELDARIESVGKGKGVSIEYIMMDHMQRQNAVFDVLMSVCKNTSKFSFGLLKDLKADNLAFISRNGDKLLDLSQ